MNLTGGYQGRNTSSDNVFLFDDVFLLFAIKAQSGLEEAYRDVSTLGDPQ